MSAARVCLLCGGRDGRHGVTHKRHPAGGGGANVPCPRHDPRCISLTDSDFNGICDCKVLALIESHQAGGSR